MVCKYDTWSPVQEMESRPYWSSKDLRGIKNKKNLSMSSFSRGSWSCPAITLKVHQEVMLKEEGKKDRKVQTLDNPTSGGGRPHLGEAGA